MNVQSCSSRVPFVTSRNCAREAFASIMSVHVCVEVTFRDKAMFAVFMGAFERSMVFMPSGSHVGLEITSLPCSCGAAVVGAEEYLLGASLPLDLSVV